jgi:heme-degrading monooxygenase HmoA
MAVKIFIKRRIPSEKREKVLDLIKRLRSMAVAQPGYISGETLRSVTNPEEYLVVSTWQSLEDWKAWEASGQRSEIQGAMDSLMEAKTGYEAYYYPQRGGVSLSDFKGWEGG